ncbi:MAG TPA: hypothetical protein VK979_06585, partial [Guyparkeria sp.]|nr:hypothetical protein [Guyparkeria sp.]
PNYKWAAETPHNIPPPTTDKHPVLDKSSACVQDPEFFEHFYAVDSQHNALYGASAAQHPTCSSHTSTDSVG